MAGFEACARLGGARERGVAEEVVPRARLVKKGTAADGLLLCDAGERPLGAATNVLPGDVGGEVEFSVAGNGDWNELTTAGALGANAEFMAAADGAVAALPSSGGGTAMAIGITHRESRAALVAGDRVIGQLYAVAVARAIAT